MKEAFVHEMCCGFCAYGFFLGVGAEVLERRGRNCRRDKD